MSKKYMTSNMMNCSDNVLTCPEISPLNDCAVSVADFCQYLNESEIRDLLTTIISRAEQSVVRRIVRNLVINRHFSEDFLCDYFNYLDESDLYINHAANIKSGEYSRIKLLFVATE